MAEKFIQKVLSKPGSKGKLHRKLGVPEGKKIPAAKIAAAKKRAKPGSELSRELSFAKTLGKLRKKK